MSYIKESQLLDLLGSVSKSVAAIVEVLIDAGLTTKNDFDKLVDRIGEDKDFQYYDKIVDTIKKLEGPKGDKLISYLSSVFGNFEDDGK